MAKIGVRKPHVAVYNSNSGNPTYTGVELLAKAVEYSHSIEQSKSNALYADDAIAESDKSFGGGELSITTDDLTLAGSKLILGVTEQMIEANGEQVPTLVYDDTTIPPYMGFGIIIPGIKEGVPYFYAVVLHKIQFNIPEGSATTRGETLEWQTPELSAAILRDDSPKRRWKSEAWLTSEESAVAWIETMLGGDAVG